MKKRLFYLDFPSFFLAGVLPCLRHDEFIDIKENIPYKYQ